MRRGLSVFCVIAMIVTVLPLTAAAQTTAVFVTDASYTSIAVGAQYGVFAYTTYEADGTQKIGTMNAEGELTREAFSPERWEEIFPNEEWAITVHGDAASFCPYAHTHISGTICPYNQVAYVTMHNKKTDVTVQ